MQKDKRNKSHGKQGTEQTKTQYQYSRVIHLWSAMCPFFTRQSALISFLHFPLHSSSPSSIKPPHSRKFEIKSDNRNNCKLKRREKSITGTESKSKSNRIEPGVHLSLLVQNGEESDEGGRRRESKLVDAVKVQRREEEEMGQMGVGDQTSTQQRTHLVRLLRHSREGGACFRRRSVLSPRRRFRIQFPR